MSPLTLFLAKLIGLLFLVFTASMALNKRAMVVTANEFIHERGLILIVAALNLTAGLAIALAHNVWHGGALTIIVTLIGWLLLLRGGFLLFTPPENLVKIYEAMHFEQNYAIVTVISGALGLYLTIAGFAG
jgi:hypothetical protein